MGYLLAKWDILYYLCNVTIKPRNIMSNHRWNVEISYYKYWFDGTIKKMRYFTHGSSKKEALKILNKINDERVKSSTWSHTIWQQY